MICVMRHAMRRRTFFLLSLTALCLASAATLPAQNDTVIENDQVRVLKVPVEAHQKTKLHEHKVNRVMIYLQPGKQDINYQDGKKAVLQFKAGEALWSPASGMHIAEITSDNPVTIMEIELKKPAASTKMANSALDPLKVDPKHYKVDLRTIRFAWSGSRSGRTRLRRCTSIR